MEDPKQPRSGLWVVPVACLVAILVAAAVTAAVVFCGSPIGDTVNNSAMGAILLLVWVFVLALCYQCFSAVIMMCARSWMKAEESPSSDLIDSKTLARTKLVMDIVFGTALVLSVTTVALRLVGLP